MLPKENRLSVADYSKLKNHKFKKLIVNYGFFVVYNDSKLGNKFGFIVSKKNFKTAVLRNKYKRLFFNTLQKNIDLEKSGKLGGKVVILHPKKVFNQEELLQDLQKIVM